MNRETLRYCLAGLLIIIVTGTVADAVKISAQAPVAVTFYKDVLPILQRNCQTCHRPGQIAPMPLLTYEDARPWARAIKAKVVAKEMPPWFADPSVGHFANERRLQQSDIDTLATWADGGAVQGDEKDGPPPIRWPADGWQINPDIIVRAPEIRIPARGIVEWTLIAVPSGITRDTWISSIEIRPSNPAVTHHICVRIMRHLPGIEYHTPIWIEKKRDASGSELPRRQHADHDRAHHNPVMPSPLLDSDSIFDFPCWVPGMAQAEDYRPYHAAKLIPANADIVFQVHYTPNGKPAVDRPQIGFTVATEKPQKRYLTLAAHPAKGTDADSFAIPPGDPNWASPPAEVTFKENAELVRMMPHMHMRGKDMTYRLLYPDGRSETVLSVPTYHFNWQINYVPAEPIKLPKGTKMIVTAHFNNSASNRFNPDPTRTVYYGDQAWEEMMAPGFAVIFDIGLDPRKVINIAGSPRF